MSTYCNLDNKETRDRLMRLETKQDHVIQILEKHIQDGCLAVDCKLNDKVLECQGDLRTYKRLTWLSLSGVISGILAVIFRALYP